MSTNLERAEREFKTLKQKYFSQGEMMETAQEEIRNMQQENIELSNRF